METAKSRLPTTVDSGNVAHCREVPSDVVVALGHEAAIAVAEGRGGERPPNGAAGQQI
jgi:hypothetical protein